MKYTMKKILLITALLLLLPVSSVFALTGGAYLQYCSSATPNSMYFPRCGSYILGVVDNMRANKAGDIGYTDVCFPDKMDEGQLVQMTVNWLKANPESLDTWAAFAASMAMYENFKCGCK